MASKIRTSRVMRVASMTGAAGGVAVRMATSRALSAGGGGEEGSARASAATRQQLAAARQLVTILGSMRGAAMKVGQSLSTVDMGLVPEEVRPEFQKILAELQHSAKPAPFREVRKIIERDLDGDLDELFASFEREPIAAASIGQVHRATLADGRRVAVKVQYPGIAEAIESDMKNLALGLKLLRTIVPGIDTAAIADEIRERIYEELDYELEAQNQRTIARLYRGHPFIVVPEVHTRLCGRRVLVTEFVEGRRFEDMVATATPEERDRFGEILVRFYLNGAVRHQFLNGDPHPGNTLFLGDGRVAFLDFGFAKRLPDDEIAQIIDSTIATRDGDPQALLEVVARSGALPDNPALAPLLFASYDAVFGWLMVDGPLQIESSKTAEMMRVYTELRNADGFEDLVLPAEHFVLLRGVMLVLGVLGQLEATNNWLDIAREWVYGTEPATDLGEAEAAFFSTRPYPARAMLAVG
ncbi:MAG: AarF/ABC1/UbiB kinase family protein [Solirubrobacteraceae bacterium]|nr:AarF/ABC1/UbiB kinase family protein [Solirubrobacteraceae bacterium]